MMNDICLFLENVKIYVKRKHLKLTRHFYQNTQPNGVIFDDSGMGYLAFSLCCAYVELYFTEEKVEENR